MIRDNSKSEIIRHICHALSNEGVAAAAKIAKRDYAFLPTPAGGRQFGRETITAVFVEDGCIDRYSGAQLVFMGSLLLLSRLLPKEVPYHPNWKIEETHMAFWELAPTIDHIVPVTRGGLDERSNWVSTSAINNSAKAHWTLEELGWTLQPPGNLSQWDGLMNWFVDYVASNPEYIVDKTIKSWYVAARKALKLA